MKKKILSLALVVAMLASMLVIAPVTGAAETNPKVEVAQVVASAGDTVAVPVTITAEDPIYAFQFAYCYDKAKLELVKIVFPDAGIGIQNQVNAEINEMAQASPYAVFSWSRSMGEDPLDATAGVRVAEFVFEVIDGDGVELGNAAVEIGKNSNSFVDISASTQKVFDFDAVSGGVNIVPEGLIYAGETPASFFVMDEEEPGVLTQGSYVGWTTGTVVLPSDVTELGYRTFLSTSFTTLIVPATVEEVASQAIRRPVAGTTVHVYILGSDTEINDSALSTNESYGTAVFHVPAGSTAADELSNPVIEEAMYMVEFEGIPCIATKAEVTVPDVTQIAGQYVIGWTDGENTYAPGETVALDGDTAFEAVTISAPAMNAGAGLKVADKIENCKMRFTTDMAIADYEALASLGTVTMGTIITPAKYVSLAGGLTKEALNALSAENGGVQTYIDVVANGYFEKTETTYTFAGSLAGFKAQNINLEYAAAFYVTVALADGSSFTIYTDFDYNANRSVGATIDAAVTAGSMTDTVANGLKALIAANKED